MDIQLDGAYACHCDRMGYEYKVHRYLNYRGRKVTAILVSEDVYRKIIKDCTINA